jgi:hypothetical protein
MFKYLILPLVACDDLVYVFELVRHGARAPILADENFLIASKGMLTPQGMR